MPVSLYPIQQEIYDKWIAHNRRGCIEMPTGTGKTYLGLKAIEDHKDKRILVVVPTRALAKQWKEFINTLGLDSQLIMSSAFTDEKSIQIAVVNSIRWQALDHDLVILDEVHRYASQCNFSFIPPSKFIAIMGLSATVEREDGLEKRIYPYAPKIYSLSIEDAKRYKLLARYDVENIAVTPSVEEQKALNEYDAYISQHFPRYKQMNELIVSSRLGDEIARKVLEYVRARINIYATSKRKIEYTEHLLRTRFKNMKVIIFTERIETAEALRGPGRFVYTSELSKEERNKVLDEFRNSNGVLVCVKALDEGLNVPDAKTAIIISSSSTRRQIIQRLGRILRYNNDERGLFIQLYLKGTRELASVAKRTREVKDSADSVKWTEEIYYGQTN